MSGQITFDYWLNISVKYELLEFEIVEDIFISKLHKRPNPASSSIDPSVSGILRQTPGVASISLSFELDSDFDSGFCDF